ncbi:hypothetical protein F4561_001129 [Lipingzhangella halophila]|uniref:Uncharacterized protein n=1 Tax=Lipingzhangella halophila TaxID=1783352 RepID=A0A7W7REA6_9ACTN|nr:hypothetical protein [Lipingzhangella halophila]MBB4930309.1 hypothetical protein [Lipingzhangella halophila]
MPVARLRLLAVARLRIHGLPRGLLSPWRLLAVARLGLLGLLGVGLLPAGRLRVARLRTGRGPVPGLATARLPVARLRLLAVGGLPAGRLRVTRLRLLSPWRLLAVTRLGLLGVGLLPAGWLCVARLRTGRGPVPGLATRGVGRLLAAGRLVLGRWLVWRGLAHVVPWLCRLRWMSSGPVNGTPRIVICRAAIAEELSCPR